METQLLSLRVINAVEEELGIQLGLSMWYFSLPHEELDAFQLGSTIFPLFAGNYYNAEKR
jgi:hypothetical protein